MDMVRSCLKLQKGFGICLISEGSEVGVTASTFPFGTLVEIVDWDRDDSGLLTVITQGVQKFRTINTSVKDDKLIVAEVEMLPPEEKTRIPAQYTELAELLHRALDSVGPLLDYDDADYTDAVWVGGRLVELLPMSAAERHGLIALDNPIDRLDALSDILRERH